jgi:hypothetical protein
LLEYGGLELLLQMFDVDPSFHAWDAAELLGDTYCSSGFTIRNISVVWILLLCAI